MVPRPEGSGHYLRGHETLRLRMRLPSSTIRNYGFVEMMRTRHGPPSVMPTATSHICGEHRNQACLTLPLDL